MLELVNVTDDGNDGSMYMHNNCVKNAYVMQCSTVQWGSAVLRVWSLQFYAQGWEGLGKTVVAAGEQEDILLHNSFLKTISTVEYC